MSARRTGIVAILAPALHLVSDLLEWRDGGFTTAQLLVNLAAFVPMPLLLYWLWRQQPARRALGLIGAALYGAAFLYFLYSTVFALAHATPDYGMLWSVLGIPYTIAGALMVIGGMLFSADAWRARWYPRFAVRLFLIGTLVNLVIALMPVPEMLQIAGSVVRNAGVIGCGVVLLRAKRA